MTVSNPMLLPSVMDTGSEDKTQEVQTRKDKNKNQTIVRELCRERLVGRLGGQNTFCGSIKTWL